MPKIAEELHNRQKRLFAAMDEERRPWYSYWGEISNYILPRRYLSLAAKTNPQTQLRNTTILDGTATQAARILAAGMMNGITSPARPWFRLRVPDQYDFGEVREWLDEVAKRMLMVMAETNFYNAFAVYYLDLCTFATAAMLIYEDDEDVFRCYNVALGEFFVQQDNRKMITRFARKFEWRLEQIVNEFGLENVSAQMQRDFKEGGHKLGVKHTVIHLIEPNVKDGLEVAAVHRFREFYWLEAGEVGQLLRHAGYRDWNAVTARWETLGNDSYGTGPSMDALGDVKQLQQMTKRKLQAMDKMVSPPLVADIMLQHQPTAFLPNGVTYVAGANSFGAKPVYQINPPLGEMSRDIEQIQYRIREFFHNDLFRMISQLDTVRSATEIDARREEKLVLLGPVLERFENEALDPALTRIFNIMLRKNLLPPPPQELADVDIEIQYVSVLNDAQRAVGAAPLERFAQWVGSIGGVRPEVLEVPDWNEMTYEYAERLGVGAKTLHTREEVAQKLAELADQQAAAGAAEVVPPMADAAKTLSETQVGGGANALQQLLGG